MSDTAKDILSMLTVEPVQPIRERDIRRAFSRRADYQETMRVLMKHGKIVTSGKGTKADPKMLRLPGVTDRKACPHCYGLGTVSA